MTENFDINYGTALEQQINDTCKALPEDVKQAIFSIFECEYYVKSDFKKLDDKLEFIVDSSSAYEQKLILFDAEFSTDKEFDSLCFFDNCSITKENDTYKLTGEAYNVNEENGFSLTVSFTSAKAEVTAFNLINSYIDLSPFEQLMNFSFSIIRKKDLNTTLNSKELALLPLLNEIKDLYLYCEKTYSFPNFKALIVKHNLLDLLTMVEKIESDDTNEKRKNKLFSKLTRKLNSIKYKPLWQEIYDLIYVSQKEYPTYIETKIPKATLTELKAKVQGIMQEYGFSGEYPNFCKKGSVKGIHLIDSYDTSYTIAFEKNAVHYIQCVENFDREKGVYITFLYGTEFLKRNESMSDINSCRFNCKGRKYATSLNFITDFADISKLSLEERIRIAVKSVEFKKLSKEERSKLFGSYSKFLVFLITFILSGFLFASLFTPAMMAFSALMLWIDGMPVVISDIPWLIFYFASWVLFGLPMGIVTIFSKK